MLLSNYLWGGERHTTINLQPLNAMLGVWGKASCQRSWNCQINSIKQKHPRKPTQLQLHTHVYVWRVRNGHSGTPIAAEEVPTLHPWAGISRSWNETERHLHEAPRRTPSPIPPPTSLDIAPVTSHCGLNTPRGMGENKKCKQNCWAAHICSCLAGGWVWFALKIRKQSPGLKARLQMMLAWKGHLEK